MADNDLNNDALRKIIINRMTLLLTDALSSEIPLLDYVIAEEADLLINEIQRLQSSVPVKDIQNSVPGEDAENPIRMSESCPECNKNTLWRWPNSIWCDTCANTIWSPSAFEIAGIATISVSDFAKAVSRLEHKNSDKLG